ncbi:unnamed protein product [Closterium sp. NIES-53]
MFWVRGSRAFVRDTSADKLSSCAIRCVFLGFPPDVPGWQFYHPTSRRVLPSQDITFDESVPFYRLFPYRSAPLPPPLLFLAPGPPLVDPLPPQGPALSGVSQVDPLPRSVPIEVTVDSGAARGTAYGGAASVGAEPASAKLGGAEPAGAELGVAETEGAEPGDPELEVAESRGAEPRAGGAGATSLEDAGVLAGARGMEVLELLVLEVFVLGILELPGLVVLGALELEELELEILAQEALELEARALAALELESLEPETLALEALELEALELEALELEELELETVVLEALEMEAQELLTLELDLLAVGVLRLAVLVQWLLFFVPPPASSLPPPDSVLPQPVSPLPAPSPYAEPINSLTKLREPKSHPASPVRAVHTSRRVPRPRPPLVPGTHVMALCPSSVPLQGPLPPPPESSLLAIPDPESDLARAASPAFSRLLATIVTDPSFESTAAFAQVSELVDFDAARRLDHATSLVAESEFDCPLSVGGECALGTDVLDDRQEDFECLAAVVPHLVAMLLAFEGDPDAPDIPTLRSYRWHPGKSTGTYVNGFPPSGANIVDGMWIFRVKWPPSSPPVFMARYDARGFSQRHGVDFFQNFSPTPKMTTLQVLLHVAAQRDYELHSLDFSTALLQGSLHEEISLRRPPGFTGSFPAGTQWSLRRPVYGLRHAPREWHDTLRTTLAALGFAPLTADPSLFLRTKTSLPPFYVLVYVDDLVFATTDTEALALVKSELQKRHTCTDLGELRSYLGLQIIWDRARRTITLTQSHMVHQALQRFGFRYSSP